MGLFNKKISRPAVRTVSAPKSLKNVRRVRADATIAANEAIYAAVSRISNTMAAMPAHLYQGYQVQRDSPKELLIQRPNSNMTWFEFIRSMEVFRNTEGNCYALIVRDGLDTPIRLDVLDPTRVRPVLHPETKELWYNVSLDDGVTYPLPGYMLLALRHMSANGFEGIRPTSVLAQTLEYDRTVKEYSVTQMKGVNQGVFLEVPNTGLGRQGVDDVIDRFLSAYERSGQRVLVLEGGLKASPFSQSPIDAKVLDVERIMRNRVATVYNIPPHLLGDYSDTSFATAEQQMQEYINLCILPIVTQWEQELDRKLLNDADRRSGFGYRFTMDALLRADTSARAAFYHNAIRDSYMRINEVREREGLAPDDHGDQLMASRDLIPLRISVEAPELLLSGASKSGETTPGKEETE